MLKPLILFLFEVNVEKESCVNEEGCNTWIFKCECMEREPKEVMDGLCAVGKEELKKKTYITDLN